jgi:hypothetical protein
MNPLKRNGLIAGALIALAASISISFILKPSLQQFTYLLVWYLASLAFCGAAGFLAGTLLARARTRLNPLFGYLAGALSGGMAFVVLFLIIFYILMSNAPSTW